MSLIIIMKKLERSNFQSQTKPEIRFLLQLAAPWQPVNYPLKAHCQGSCPCHSKVTSVKTKFKKKILFCLPSRCLCDLEIRPRSQKLMSKWNAQWMLTSCKVWRISMLTFLPWPVSQPEECLLPLGLHDMTIFHSRSETSFFLQLDYSFYYKKEKKNEKKTLINIDLCDFFVQSKNPFILNLITDCLHHSTSHPTPKMPLTCNPKNASYMHTMTILVLTCISFVLFLSLTTLKVFPIPMKKTNQSETDSCKA